MYDIHSQQVKYYIKSPELQEFLRFFATSYQSVHSENG